MSSVIFRHDCVILDACCAINLYATKQMSAILEALPVRCTVANYVYEEEILEMYSGLEDKVTQTKELIRLHPFVENKLLTIASLHSEKENIEYANFAYDGLDNGEAMTGAIAKHRNWCIGTDDNNAISFFKRETPQLQIVTTMELVKTWVERASPSSDMIISSIKNIRQRARYKPGPKHPLYEWWRSYCDEEASS
jgi:hypothetical protein